MKRVTKHWATGLDLNFKTTVGITKTFSPFCLVLSSRGNIYHFCLPSSPVFGNSKVGGMLQKVKEGWCREQSDNRTSLAIWMLQVLWYFGRGLYKRTDYLRQLQWGGNNAHNVKVSVEGQWHWHWARLVLGHDPSCVLVPFAPPYILNLVLQPPYWFDKLPNIRSFSAYVSQSWFLLFGTKTDRHNNDICDLSKRNGTGFLDLNCD